MEPRICTYDPVKDIAPVEQLGFVDLAEAFVNGCVPGSISASEESFNGVDDPASLLGRPSDIFDALRRAEYVQKGSAKSEPSSVENTERE